MELSGGQLLATSSQHGASHIDDAANHLVVLLSGSKRI
jgi:hypothetical protein